MTPPRGVIYRVEPPASGQEDPFCARNRRCLSRFASGPPSHRIALAWRRSRAAWAFCREDQARAIKTDDRNHR